MTFEREGVIWAAGIIEGEGNFYVHKDRYLRITVKMVDNDILKRLQKVFGVGRINGPYDRGNKPVYQWSVQQSAHAYAVAVAILPWLGERRTTQAIELVSKFNPPYLWQKRTTNNEVS